MNAPAPPPSPDAATSTGDSRCLWDDRDEKDSVWDGIDDPDDDLISRVCYNQAREE